MLEQHDPHEGDRGADHRQQCEHVRLTAGGGGGRRDERGDGHEPGHSHDAHDHSHDDRPVDGEAAVVHAEQDRDDQREGAHRLHDHHRSEGQRDDVGDDARTHDQQTQDPVRRAEQAHQCPQSQSSFGSLQAGDPPMLQERSVREGHG